MRAARLSLIPAIVSGLCGAILIDLYLVITEPYVAHGVTPLLVMQWDASNALGMAAYRGGLNGCPIHELAEPPGPPDDCLLREIDG